MARASRGPRQARRIVNDQNPPPDDERPEGHQPEAVRATITLLQRRGIEAEVLIPLIRRLEQEIGREAAHRITRETIEAIAREQGHAVAEVLQRRDLEGFHHVKDTWSGAGGDLQIDTLREDAEALEFNVTGWLALAESPRPVSSVGTSRQPRSFNFSSASTDATWRRQALRLCWSRGRKTIATP